MSGAFSLLALCVVAALICLLLSGYKSEYSFAAVIAAGSFIFISVIREVLPAFSRLSSLADSAGFEGGYFKIALKALGICFVTQFAADTCRDFGQSALAAKAEFIGKCAVFLLSLPLLESILQSAASLIGGI